MTSHEVPVHLLFFLFHFCLINCPNFPVRVYRLKRRDERSKLFVPLEYSSSISIFALMDDLNFQCNLLIERKKWGIEAVYSLMSTRIDFDLHLFSLFCWWCNLYKGIIFSDVAIGESKNEFGRRFRRRWNHRSPSTPSVNLASSPLVHTGFCVFLSFSIRLLQRFNVWEGRLLDRFRSIRLDWILGLG